MGDVALADKTATSAPLATTCATPATIRRPRCPSLCAYAPAPLPPLLAPLDPYYLADEVRNYLFGSDAAQFECYRRWAIETGAPALKGLLPHVGGEVVGFCPAQGYAIQYTDGDSEHLRAAQVLRVLTPAPTGQ